jgi:hypothetical protein
MEFRKLRVRDFFCLLDRDNTGVVTLEELQIGVHAIHFAVTLQRAVLCGLICVLYATQ